MELVGKQRWMVWGVAAGFLLGLAVFSIWDILSKRWFKGAKKQQEPVEEGFTVDIAGSVAAAVAEAKKGPIQWDEESARQACPYFKSALYSSEFALKELKERGELEKNPERKKQIEGYVAEYKQKCEEFGCDRVA